MRWHKINLTNKQVESGVHTQIQKQFETLWHNLHAPDGAAMFSDARMESEGMTIYLSPDSIKFMQSIINKHSGVETECPNANEIAFHVGADDAVEKLLK